MQFIEPLKDIRDHECCGPRGAVLSGDVGLLSEACGHVVHNGHDNAHWLLWHWDTLGQLQLWGKTHQVRLLYVFQIMLRRYISYVLVVES